MPDHGARLGISKKWKNLTTMWDEKISKPKFISVKMILEC